jgi:hypothetical protein
MENLYIPATRETPEVSLMVTENRLAIVGESYPENAMAFYAPIRSSLESFLESPKIGEGLEAHFSLRYFNSSSTKLIRSLVAMLNKAGEGGHKVVARWFHDPEDDMMAEFGMDLREEFDQIQFHVIAQGG